MMPYCTSYFKFLFERIWGFSKQNMDFSVGSASWRHSFFWQMQNIVDRLKHKKICKWWNNSWFNIERILHNCLRIGSFKSWVSDKNKDMILRTKFKVNIYGTWHFVLRCSTRIKYQKAMSERQPGCSPDKRFPIKTKIWP